MKNYNIFALRGDTETNDVDVCRTLGLPLELAGTPGINNAAVEKMYQQNVKGMVDKGVKPDVAYALAAQRRTAVESELKELLKDQ